MLPWRQHYWRDALCGLPGVVRIPAIVIKIVALGGFPAANLAIRGGSAADTIARGARTVNIGAADDSTNGVDPPSAGRGHTPLARDCARNTADHPTGRQAMDSNRGWSRADTAFTEDACAPAWSDGRRWQGSRTARRWESGRW